MRGRLMMKRWIAAAAALTGLIGTGASAQLITINGDTTGAPTYNRAFSDFSQLSNTGSDVGFQAVPFSVAANGNVRLETIVGPTEFDTFIFLYSSFNPADALANGIAGNDDGGAGPCGGFDCSLINQVLAPGNYVAVVTSFANGQVGVFRLEIEGPVFVGLLGNAGDTEIMAVETAVAVVTAQTQGLRQILLANKAARDTAAAGASSMVMSPSGISTAEFSVWAEVAGSKLSGDFGDDLELSAFLGQAGVEAVLSNSLVAGVSVGGSLTDAETSTINVDGDAIFVQPYMAFIDGGLNAIASLAFTHTKYDDDTNTIDDSQRFSGSLFVSYDMAFDGETTFTPFGYVAGGIESFNRASALDDADFVIGRAGLELSRSFDLVSTGSMRTFASGAVEFVTTGEQELAAAALSDYDDDRIGGRVEIGLDFTLSGTGTQIFAAGNGAGLFSDATSFGGRFGLKIPF
jgi:Autotransporter beta-domain